MIRKLRLLAAVATLGVALMFPVTAFAGGGPAPTGSSTTTVQIDGKALLVTPNEIFVKLTYTCFPPAFGFGSFGSVTVSQVQPGTAAMVPSPRFAMTRARRSTFRFSVTLRREMRQPQPMWRVSTSPTRPRK